MTKFDVITIGGAVRDITLYTNQGKIFATPEDLTAQKMLAFEFGAKINAQKAYYNLGGGAANTAIALARLQFKTAAIVRLGKDQDAFDIRGRFRKEKVNTSFIQIDPKEHTGFSFILGLEKKEHEHIAFLCRGANNNLTVPTKQLPWLQTDWLYVTSLSGNRWAKTLRSFYEFAKDKKRNIKIVWNPGNTQLQTGKKGLSSYLKQTEILILNKDEAIELVLSGLKIGRRDPSYLNRPLYLLNILKEWGPKIVLITAGKKGAWAYDGSKIFYQKSKSPKKTVDTTGVGDAFGSSFLAGYIATRGDLNQALKWGITNASSVCTQVGAQNGLLKLDELKKII